MGLTAFPNGVSSFGMPQLGVGEETATTGNVFFVDSGSGTGADNASAGKNPAVPFLTIDYAIGQCTANNGDIIFVMPGHAETVAATDIAMDVAGVWVRGLGWGADRPTITYSATGSTIAMSAASCRISNLRLVPGIADVVAAVTMTGDDLIVEGCETVEAAVFEFTYFCSLGVTTAGSDRSIIRNNVFKSLAAAGTTSGILLTGSNDVQIVGNYINGHFGGHAIDNVTAGTVDECINILIAGNFIRNASATGGDSVITMDANATGLLISNMMTGGLALDANIVGGNVRSVNNWMSDADDSRAVAIPVTSSA